MASDYCIFFTVDNAFVPPLAVTLQTLFSATTGRRINIVIALIDVTAKNADLLKKTCLRPSVSVVFKNFDMTPFRAFPTCSTISLAAYARLFAPEILPAEWSKALYLDSDLLIRKDIAPLWDTDINDYALAAVGNPLESRNRELGMPPNAPYINSGLLLINLRYWREQNVSKTLADFAAKNAAILAFHDQDTLNACLYSKTLILPPTWNVMHSFFLEPWTRLRNLPPGLLRALRSDPAIVHFTGPTKPWKYSSAHPFQTEWLRILDQTAFPYFRPKPTLSGILIRNLKAYGRPVKRAVRVAWHLSRRLHRHGTIHAPASEPTP